MSSTEQNRYIDGKLIDLQGQILGLRSILLAILVSNPDIKVDAGKAGALINKWPLGDAPLHHPDVQTKAREVMHTVLSERAG